MIATMANAPEMIPIHNDIGTPYCGTSFQQASEN
jgi:hypothetical protein